MSNARAPTDAPQWVDLGERAKTMRRPVAPPAKAKVGGPSAALGPAVVDYDAPDFRTGTKPLAQSAHVANPRAPTTAPQWTVYSTDDMRLSDKAGRPQRYVAMPFEPKAPGVVKGTHTKEPSGVRAFPAKVGAAQSAATVAPSLAAYAGQGKVEATIARDKKSKLRLMTNPEAEISASAVRATDTRTAFGTRKDKAQRVPLPARPDVYGRAREEHLLTKTMAPRDVPARTPVITRSERSVDRLVGEHTCKRGD